jgi:hypothetical protein
MKDLKELLNKTLTPKQTIGIISSLGLFIMLVVFASYNTSFITNNNVANVSVATNSDFSQSTSQTCSSIKYFSITWTFDKEYPCGQFANGEPWVVGPITITAIDPTNNNVVWDESYPGDSGPNSGSMKLTVPNTFQGYATKLKYFSGLPLEGVYYKKELDVSRNLPSTLQAGEMLMTARGQVEVGDVRSSTNEIAVLTSLDTAPPEGSFRPGLFSKGPRVVTHKKSDINYGVLKNLPAVSATPSQAQIEKLMPGLPWFEFDSSWVQSSFGPTNNFATDGQGVSYPNASSVYGREIANKWSTVALWLNTNNEQSVKEKTMIQTIQSGIDIASFLENGGMFYADGGHKLGRKFPVLLAGLALNDAKILSIVSSEKPLYFAEDQSTFIVCGAEDTQYCPPGHTNDIGRVVSGGADAQYRLEDVGLPDWGVKHTFEPQHDDRRWWSLDGFKGVPYREMWPSSAGSILATEIMGQKNTWNHVPTFMYNERYFERMNGLGDSFAGQMWAAYKQYDDARVQPVVISPNGGKLSSAKQVTLSTQTTGAQIKYTTDGTMPNIYSSIYTSPLTVSTSQTIQAIAYKDGMRASAITSATFTFDAKADWTVHYVSSEEPLGGLAIQAFDNNPSTNWHSVWRNAFASHPHEIQINLGKLQTLDGFSYLTRQDNEENGTIGQYEFYVSTDGTNWGSPVSTGVFPGGKDAKIVSFSPVTAQYIRLRALSATRSWDPYVSVAEIGVSVADTVIVPVTPTTPVITTPLNNTIFPSNTTNVAVSWTGDATNYIVRYITTNNSTGVATTNTANTSNKTYSVQVTQGNSYKFYVAAGTETNKSPEANVNFSIEKQVSQTYTLTATTTGTGNGTIAGNLTNYKEGDIAILTATPDSSSTFNGWSGCTSVSNNVCSINMTGTTIIKNVTATFNIKVSTSLTISSPTNQVYPSSIKSITAKWTATPAPLSYFVTVTDLTDPNKNRKTNNTYVYKDLYTSTSLKFSVSRGHSYKLSVSTGTAYNHGPETTVNFSVAR